MDVVEEILQWRSLLDIPLEPFSWMRLMHRHGPQVAAEEEAIFARRPAVGDPPSRGAIEFVRASLLAGAQGRMSRRAGWV